MDQAGQDRVTGADMAAARQAMVVSQLRPNAVTDPGVLAAMATVPREAFVPAERRSVAYTDRPVPLGGGRAMNPPMVTGRLLSEARPRAGERALVIGSPYAAAILARIGADVVALDVAEAAEGAGEGEFDLIVIDGAVEQVPDGLRARLIDGGRLVTALVERGVTRLAIGRKGGDGFGLRAFADAEAVVLPGFTKPQAFTF